MEALFRPERATSALIVETTDRRDFPPGQDVHLVIDPEALLTLDR